MKKFLLINLFLFLFLFFLKASPFDSIEWEKVYELNGVIVFVQKNKKEKLNYYKAEKIISNKCADALYKNILDFDSYPKIFPRTTVFKKIKQLNHNKFIMYSMINFKPLKNRDYYICFEFIQNEGQYMAEWSSVSENDFTAEYPQKNVIRATSVNGRWNIVDNGKTTKISVELHNNFEFNMPAATLLPYEITSAAEMIDDLVDYTLKKG